MTAIISLANSQISKAAEQAAAAETAAERKVANYATTQPANCLVPLTFETLDLMNLQPWKTTSDASGTVFLFQCISIAIQCFIV